jgi:hypothetical protein
MIALEHLVIEPGVKASTPGKRRIYIESGREIVMQNLSRKWFPTFRSKMFINLQNLLKLSRRNANPNLCILRILYILCAAEILIDRRGFRGVSASRHLPISPFESTTRAVRDFLQGRPLAQVTTRSPTGGISVLSPAHHHRTQPVPPVSTLTRFFWNVGWANSRPAWHSRIARSRSQN